MSFAVAAGEEEFGRGDEKDLCHTFSSELSLHSLCILNE